MFFLSSGSEEHFYFLRGSNRQSFFFRPCHNVSNHIAMQYNVLPFTCGRYDFLVLCSRMARNHTHMSIKMDI